MTTVVMHNVVSVDGFIADANDDVGPLFDWYGNGGVEINQYARVSKASADYVQPAMARIGTLVVGRHVFDMTNGWEGVPPAGEHLVVVSHRPRPVGWHPDAPFHFVDGVAEAVAKARELTGQDRDIGVAAGDVGGQAFALGLVDEVAMDVVPVLRLGQAVLRLGRRPAPARGPARRDPGRPGAAPAPPGPATAVTVIAHSEQPPHIYRTHVQPLRPSAGLLIADHP